MTLPLEGIKVVDFSQVQAGPACSQLLAWFGAGVLKVECVDGGDITRHQLREIRPHGCRSTIRNVRYRKRAAGLLCARLSAFEIPERIYIVTDFPHTAKGAIDRRTLAAQFSPTRGPVSRAEELERS